jgi:hypothetical protein
MIGVGRVRVVLTFDICFFLKVFVMKIILGHPGFFCHKVLLFDRYDPDLSFDMLGVSVRSDV